MFNDMHYNMPPWSISILSDCRNVVFNTAKVCEHNKLVQSTGHALHVFINGQLSGTNKIALLSVAAGLPNIGGHFETWKTGVSGPVALHGLYQGKWDLSWKKWTYQVGLKGEAMKLDSPNGVSSVDWMKGYLIAQKQQPLIWHKAYFNAPEGLRRSKIAQQGDKNVIRFICKSADDGKGRILSWRAGGPLNDNVMVLRLTPRQKIVFLSYSQIHPFLSLNTFCKEWDLRKVGVILLIVFWK